MSNQSSGRIDESAIWISRALLIVAVLASVWCIAADSATGRFVSLAIVMLSLGASVFDRRSADTSPRSFPIVLAICFIAVAFSLVQIVPLGGIAKSLSPGMAETRNDFTSLTLTNGDKSLPADNPWQTISISTWESKTAISTLVIGLIGITLGWRLFQDDRSRLLLLIGFSFCGATQVFWGIIQQFAYPDQILWGVPNPGNSTPFGSFLNRNHAADFIGMSAACAAGLLVWCYRNQTEGFKPRYTKRTITMAWLLQPLVLSSCLLCGWLLLGLLLSLSRGAWLSASISIALVTLLWGSFEAPTARGKNKSNKKHRLTNALAALGAVTASIIILMLALKLSGFSDRVDRRIDSISVSSIQSDARWEHWLQSLSAAKNYLPFGSGVGTYGYAHLPFTQSTEGSWYSHAHNQYLETLVETGLIGFIILVALLIAFGLSMRGVLSRDRTSGERAIGFAVLVAFTMQLLHASVDFGLAMPANLLGLSVLMGSGLAAAKPRTSKLNLRTSETASNEKQLTRAFYVHQSDRTVLSGPLLGTFLLVSLAVPSSVHLSRCMLVEETLRQTRFSDRTPAPTVEVALRDIETLSDLITKVPGSQQPRLRRARLRMHVSRRKHYDALKALAMEQGIDMNHGEIWQRVGSDNAIFVLHQSRDQDAKAAQSDLTTQFARDPQLILALKELQESAAINPMQVKTHLLLAKVAALTGRDWKQHFQRLENLSSGDPETSFAIGLLAHSVGDYDSMLRHWRQTIRFAPKMLETIVQAARHSVLDEEVANRLMPETWGISYRLSLKLRGNDADRHFRELLLRRATELIVDSDLDDQDRFRAHYQISHELGDYSAAAEWLLKAVQLEPHDPDLRYQVANALVKSHRFNEAKSHVRIGSGLAPNEQRFQKLLANLQRREN